MSGKSLVETLSEWGELEPSRYQDDDAIAIVAIDGRWVELKYSDDYKSLIPEHLQLIDQALKDAIRDRNLEIFLVETPTRSGYRYRVSLIELDEIPNSISDRMSWKLSQRTYCTGYYDSSLQAYLSSYLAYLKFQNFQQANLYQTKGGKPCLVRSN